MSFNLKLGKSSKLAFALLPFYVLTKYSKWFSPFLQIVPTVDSFLGFFSKDASTVIAWAVLFVVGHNVEITVSQRLFGEFKRKRLIDLITVLYGSVVGITLTAPILGPHNQDMVIMRILYSNLTVVIVLLSFLGAALYLLFDRILRGESSLETMHGPLGHFWRLVAPMQGQTARAEYQKTRNISNKLIRRLTQGAWVVAPGVVWLAIVLSFAILLMILSLSAIIFLFSVFLWSALQLRIPGAEESVFASLHKALTVNLGKGIYGNVLVIAGFLWSLLFFLLITTTAFERAFLPILFLAVPFGFLFYFWYRQARRLPVFIRVWSAARDLDKEVLIWTLPAGGYLSFVAVCCLSLINPFVFTACYPSFTFWATSLAGSGAVIMISVLSLGRTTKMVSVHRVKRDNVLIVAALLTQLICTALLFRLWLKVSIFAESAMAGGLLLFVWFLEDWSRLIRGHYKEKSITGLALRYIALPLGTSPMLVPRTRILDLVYVGLNLLFGFFFYAEVVGAVSPSKDSRSVPGQ